MGQQFVLRPFGQLLFPFGFVFGFVLQHAEKGVLPSLPVLDDARGARQDAVNLAEQGRPIFAQAIARAGFDQRLQHLAVDSAAIDPLAKFGERSKRPALARLQQAFHRHLPDALDGRQPEANGLAARGEEDIALVDIGREHLNAKNARLADEDAQLGQCRPCRWSSWR